MQKDVEVVCWDLELILQKNIFEKVVIFFGADIN